MPPTPAQDQVAHPVTSSVSVSIRGPTFVASRSFQGNGSAAHVRRMSWPEGIPAFTRTMKSISSVLAFALGFRFVVVLGLGGVPAARRSISRSNIDGGGSFGVSLRRNALLCPVRVRGSTIAVGALERPRLWPQNGRGRFEQWREGNRQQTVPHPGEAAGDPRHATAMADPPAGGGGSPAAWGSLRSASGCSAWCPLSCGVSPTRPSPC